VVPECKCPSCGRLLDRATAADGSGALPEPGDPTVCLCGTLLQFRADLTVEPLDWYRLDVETKEALLRVQSAVLDVRFQSIDSCSR
jgi:hypothetical protein